MMPYIGDANVANIQPLPVCVFFLVRVSSYNFLAPRISKIFKHGLD